jgi:long-chain acyl-CoA synthetase
MTSAYSGDRERTHLAILENSMKAAAGFMALGAKVDSGIGVMMRNDFVFYEASKAAAHAGSYFVPINWHFKGEEVTYLLENSNSSVLVIHADLLPQIDGALPDGVTVLAVPTPPEVAATYGIPDSACVVPAGVLNWDDWLAEQTALEAPATDAPGAMFYTSGTTGKPKGVKRAKLDPEIAAQAMQSLMAASMEAWGFNSLDIRTVVTGPMYHSAPNSYANASSMMGLYTVLQPKFDAEDFLQLVEHHKLTHAIMVPTMFVRLLALPDDIKSKYDLSTLQWVTHGAAPCSPEVKRQMIDWFGPVIYEYYGGTEMGLVSAVNSEDALARPGTVGKALSGATIKIFDDDGVELGPNEVGDIYVGMKGMPDFTYHGHDEKRAEIGRQGLVCIGDVGSIDEDGFLFLRDRKIEMVISGGVNIYPAEIESSLVTMPGVADCAVFGIPNEEFGESLCAHVQLVPGVDIGADDVKAFMRGEVAGYKVPRTVEFTDELPREDSGKIWKKKLRAPYWEGMDRQI